jgi:hypothetical protein
VLKQNSHAALIAAVSLEEAAVQLHNSVDAVLAGSSSSNIAQCCKRSVAMLGTGAAAAV